MNKPKLLIVTTIDMTFNYILKGQPKFLNNFFSITVGSSNYQGIKNFAKDESVEFIHIPMYRRINPIYDIFSILSLIRDLLRIKPDIIHSYTPKAGLICAISAFIVGTPKRLHTFTGLIFPNQKFLLRKILSSTDNLICRLNTHIIAEGEGVKRQLIDAGIASKNINIIGNGNIAGVDTHYFNRRHPNLLGRVNLIRKQLLFTSNTITFSYVGRINEQKGILELLKAFEMLSNEEIKLILVGDFEKHDRFSKRIKKYYSSPQNNIFWVGWHSDIRPYLAVSDCFILPSYREGFPNVLLQAGAMKLPSIVTDVPGSNEIIQDGYNGWIIPSKDSYSILVKLKNVITLPKLELEKFGQNAQNNIKEKYEKSDYQETLVKFYQSLQIDKKNI